MSHADRLHLERVAALGCLICRKEMGVFTPTSIHHVRTLHGRRIKRNDQFVIPLCPTHHQYGGPGTAFHAGSRQWQHIHGTEEQLLDEVQALLELSDAS